MSTTLTNGLKLPDKGSVDWYADMQNNYAILDGAVGTVAEHTSALAGKAPLVHTHTKSDITDFPAYGNTAGTICEGNDSRLSDARTPVAHTHTKSDVTNLFNSANTWTALNSYNQSIQITANFDIGTAPSSDVYGGFNFGNANTNIGNVTARVSSTGITYSRLYVSNKYANGALDPNGTLTNVELQVGLKANGNRFIYTNAFWSNSLTPDTNNTYDLGSSSYQWNNLYAKNYYYNGVAWGLDKDNTWTGANIFNDSINISRFKASGIRLFNNDVDITANSGQPEMTVSDSQSFISFKSKQAQFALLDFTVVPTSTYTQLRFATRFYVNSSSFKSVVIDAVVDSSNNKSFAPSTNNEVNLGTSTNKWKSLNGVNPGALSLPDFSNADPIDTRNWVISTPTNNIYTPSENGWLNVVVADSSPSGNEFSLYVKSTNFFASAVHKLADIDDSKGKVGLFIPVMAGITYYVVVKGNISNITISATFFPCLGSV